MGGLLMSKIEARIALAKLIAERIKELGITQADFMRGTGFIQDSTFTCYLRGYSSLPLWQVPYVAKILQLDEQLILMMCLAQLHDTAVMELFKRHIRPRRKRS